jgi:putative transposase
VEDCRACYHAPASHRLRVRTTNGLERLHQELKRRTRVVRSFPNRAALPRLVTALAMEQSEEWVSGRRYLTWEPPEEVPTPTATSVAAVA